MNNKTLLLLFLLCSLQLSCYQQEQQILCVQELNKSWLFYELDDDNKYPAEVPGAVHLDLFDNDLISDPYSGTNEDSLQWIEESNWVYETTFDVDSELWKKENIEVNFEGLDTYAEVFLNDSLILKANNMFREWTVEIKGILKQTQNNLKVVFTSPILKNKEAFLAADYELPSGNEQVDIKIAPYTRKAPYQFGWDWGPRFVTAGIWRKVELRGWNKAKINNVYTYTESFSESSALQKVEIEILSNSIENQNVILKVNQKEHELVLVNGLNYFELDHKIDTPVLWWPNGFGDSKLYDLDIVLEKETNVLDTNHSKFGVRSVYLHQERDSIGEAFYFEINGEDIFAKGANYIPQDLFLPRVKESQYRSLLQKAKDANINMLRVWGGGVYEEDLFYDLCDSLGIMVWQDFMFAGSLYPEDQEFYNNVEQEIEDNVKRLRSHPCLVLWCGNNEVEVAMENWGWEDKFEYTQEQQDRIKANYYNLFDHWIPRKLEKFDKNTPYVHTSPLSNWGTPENFNSSTMHYWGVWHGPDSFEGYKMNVGRFMVEYGFQSFPSYSLLSNYIDSSEMHLDSETMNKRQKSYIGNGLIKKFSEELYGETESFEQFIINSQKTQAKAMKIAIQSHRLNRGHCMGTLFWQWNDCWPGPSWSAIQYDGEDKILYSTVKKWYAPVIGWLEKSDQSLSFIVCSDLDIGSTLDVNILIDGKNQKEYLESFQVQMQSHTEQVVLESKDLQKLLRKNKKLGLNYTIQISSQGKQIFSDNDSF